MNSFSYAKASADMAKAFQPVDLAKTIIVTENKEINLEQCSQYVSIYYPERHSLQQTIDHLSEKIDMLIKMNEKIVTFLIGNNIIKSNDELEVILRNEQD